MSYGAGKYGMWKGLGLAAAVIVGLGSSSRAAAPSSYSAADLGKLKHIVVIYLENRSFDNLYSEFPWADGRTNAFRAPKQVDLDGRTYDSLPEVNGSRFPTGLRNQPFNIAAYLPPSVPSPSPVHRFYQQQMQINGGRMDRFVAVSDAYGLVMGYYHTSQLPLAAEAMKYTLADHFFHSAFGGSFLNHFYLISAAVPIFRSAPDSLVTTFDANGRIVRDGMLTPDKYVVNTAYSVNTPHPAGLDTTGTLVPYQTMPTIGDRLSEKNISWAWYAGGWNDALAGKPDPVFQYHHQPFIYFAKYADGTRAKKDHLKDETDFLLAARSGTLPAVSFVKPLGMNNEHPDYADVITGELHTLELIDEIRNGPEWKSTAIIVTYDENGGFWDHVAPPKIDRWGPGARVPTIIISPYAKKGYVDHTPYETVSILAFLEKRFGLAPLGSRDAQANPLTGAFDFSQKP